MDDLATESATEQGLTDDTCVYREGNGDGYQWRCVLPAEPIHPGEHRLVSMRDADINPFAGYREFTVMLRVGERWQPVGTSGTFEHVKDEMADWRRDCPDAVLVYAQRDVGPWDFGDKR